MIALVKIYLRDIIFVLWGIVYLSRSLWDLILPAMIASLSVPCRPLIALI